MSSGSITGKRTLGTFSIFTGNSYYVIVLCCVSGVVYVIGSSVWRGVVWFVVLAKGSRCSGEGEVVVVVQPVSLGPCTRQ